jgi:carbon-monoxide dehydrogenase small subunit
MSKQLITLIVNGDSHELAVPVHATLLDVIRDELRLTGTKRGCTSGSCGVCTVQDGAGNALLSCLSLAIEWDGQPITTIEGVGRPGELHPLQRAFLDCGAVQCGYCTPGLVMTVRALLAENPGADAEAINEALAGALCRCTGHIKVKQAVAHAVAAMAAKPAATAGTATRGSDGTPA